MQNDCCDSFLLVRHPPVLRRVQKEIADIMRGDSTPTRAHVQKLHYLRCVLNESAQALPNLLPETS